MVRVILVTAPSQNLCVTTPALGALTKQARVTLDPSANAWVTKEISRNWALCAMFVTKGILCLVGNKGNTGGV